MMAPTVEHCFWAGHQGKLWVFVRGEVGGDMGVIWLTNSEAPWEEPRPQLWKLLGWERGWWARPRAGQGDEALQALALLKPLNFCSGGGVPSHGLQLGQGLPVSLVPAKCQAMPFVFMMHLILSNHLMKKASSLHHHNRTLGLRVGEFFPPDHTAATWHKQVWGLPEPSPRHPEPHYTNSHFVYFRVSHESSRLFSFWIDPAALGAVVHVVTVASEDHTTWGDVAGTWWGRGSGAWRLRVSTLTSDLLPFTVGVTLSQVPQFIHS